MTNISINKLKNFCGLADIEYIELQQINSKPTNILEWADAITCHGIMGELSNDFLRIVQAPSPTVTTNTFLSTNSDLTKALLANVFDSSTKQRDLDQQQLKALKQQNALQQQTLDFMRRLVTNTKGYSLSQVSNIGP
jgi:hypothetical protein